MYKDDVVRYFKKKISVAEALGLSHVAVVKWKSIIPKLRAMELDKLTNGELKYKPELYARKITDKKQKGLNNDDQL
ncbi:transcriptional regulator [Salmonella enterica subsp. enterica serovar Oranienburg]|nr:transcriptional regulator [Salmonella enterica subsp. enterica serovar Oranienburg]